MGQNVVPYTYGRPIFIYLLIYLFIYLFVNFTACMHTNYSKYGFVYSYYRHVEGMLATGASILSV